MDLNKRPEIDLPKFLLLYWMLVFFNPRQSLFTRRRGNSSFFIIVYIDDIVITGNDIQAIQHIKHLLHQQFRIKDLGNIKYFLGKKVARSKPGIFLNQRKYVLDLLEDSGLEGARIAYHPMA